MTIPEKADLILTNGYVLTMDSKRQIYSDGAIAVKAGRIAAVGRTADILRQYEGPVHNCQGGVVHPGLVDAHEHLCLHITRGWEPDSFTVHDTWTRFEALAYPAVTDAQERASVELATLEMAKNGTTAFSDTGSAFSMEAVIEPVNRVGIRGIIGCVGGDNFPPELQFLSGKTDALLARMARNLHQYGKASGLRVRAGVQLCGMGDCSDPLVTGAKALARETDDVLFMHQCVYPEEIAQYAEKYGQTPVEHLAALGVLDSKTALVHMIHLTDADVAVLAQTGAGVIHCPAASLKYGLGASSVGKFPELDEAGVPLALGTDSGTWADAMDVFQLVYLAATIHREARRTQLSLRSYRAFEMATLGGAAVLGMAGEIGALAPGMRADLVIHTAQLPECQPPFDPFTNLVYAARSKSVRDVLVEGEWIVRDGHAVRVDEEAVLAHARETAAAFAKRTGYRLYSPWPVV